MTIYGPIVTGQDVRDAAEATIKLWLPAYLAEVGRQKALDSPLPLFRSYNPALTFSDRAEYEQLPQCIIVAPGLAAPPRRDGRAYEATWAVGVGIVAMADTWEHTLVLGELYAAVVRSIMVQHRSLGGVATNTVWTDEKYDQIEGDNESELVGAIVNFDVTVENVVDSGAGPTSPPEQPGTSQQWPQVKTIEIVETVR
jgi:hypothetical protein